MVKGDALVRIQSLRRRTEALIAIDPHYEAGAEEAFLSYFILSNDASESPRLMRLYKNAIYVAISYSS